MRQAEEMMEIVELTPEQWARWREVRLRALADAPSAFGEKLADWRGDGDTEERWRSRLENVPFNVVAVNEGRPVGQASGLVDRDTGQGALVSMWVAPEARGTGTGDRLIDAVRQWCIEQELSELSLRVRVDNARAIAFYRRLGFVMQGDRIDNDYLMAMPVSAQSTGPVAD